MSFNLTLQSLDGPQLLVFLPLVLLVLRAGGTKDQRFDIYHLSNMVPEEDTKDSLPLHLRPLFHYPHPIRLHLPFSP